MGTSVGEERAVPRRTPDTESVDEQSVVPAAAIECVRRLLSEREVLGHLASMNMARTALAVAAEGRETKCRDRVGRLPAPLSADAHGPGACRAVQARAPRARFECVDDVIGGGRP